MKIIWDFLNSDWHERSCISFFSMKTGNFRSKTLDQMPNCHSGWDSMRIYNDVWHNSFLSKWHIFLFVCHSTSSFLSMSRCKLISYLRNLDSSHLDLCEKASFFICRENNLIYNSIFRRLKRSRNIFDEPNSLWLSKHCRSRSFSNDNVISNNILSRMNQAVVVKFLIVSMSSSNANSSRDFKLFVILFHAFVMISSKENRSKETSVNCVLVYNDRVFLIVACITCNSHNCIATSRKLFEVKKI